MHSSIQELQQAYLRGELVVFAGAGISAAGGLPSWKALTEQLLEHGAARGVAPDALEEARELFAERKFIDALSAVKHALGGPEFCAFIERKLDDKDLAVPESALAIASLSANLRAILTTNIDRFLERALAGRWPVLTKSTPDVAQRKGFLLKVHGTLHERETWVFTRDDYDRAMYATPLAKTVFSALFHGRTLLFLGYGLSDDDFDQLLGSVRALAGDQPPRHFAIVPAAGIRTHRRKVLEGSGVSLITYDNADGVHGELVELIRAIGRPSGVDSTGAKSAPTTTIKLRGASEGAQRIVDQRPTGWEIRLLHLVLSEAIAKVSDRRRDLTLGIALGGTERLDGPEVFDWVIMQFEVIERALDALTTLINEALPAAFGDVGEPGDPEAIIYVANRIGDAYQEILAWGLRWRRLRTDQVFKTTMTLGESAGARLVAQIEDWHKRMGETIRDVLDGSSPPPSDTTIHLGMTVDLPPHWVEDMSAEIQRLRHHFGATA